MANQEHLDLLKQENSVWNVWREQHQEIKPDLSGATLSGANLTRTDLTRADLSGANLTRTDLTRADLSGANLTRADLSGATLSEANLTRADLSGATLSEANLTRAILVNTNLTDATLMDCHIYGISAWSVELEGATQDNLVITPENEPTITVDNLKIAQFIYLLLNNKEIRDVIDTITKKMVLILGRFTLEQKAILDAIRDELRRLNYLPVLFDFERPDSRDITETLSTLAHLSYFIIADLTNPSSVPNELSYIVPNLVVPVQPIMYVSGREFSMFESFSKYPWVLKTCHYNSSADLLSSLKEKIIKPAEEKAQELEKIKREQMSSE